MDDWVLFGHVLFAIIWMGGLVYVEALAATARRRSDPIAVGAYFRDTAALNQRLLNAAGVVTIVLGLWLVSIEGWGLGDMWVALSIAIVGIIVITDLFYTTPRMRSALDLIDERGPADTDVRSLIDQTINVGRVRLGFLVIVLFLMIFRPVL